jgi:flavin reductase (DIM6/NTAB) family NADH-FMN oxidoreductase RutF
MGSRTASYAYRIEDGHSLRHNPLKAIVAPRPIGWISTLSADGIANLAPYSFFNLVNDAPPMLMFSSTGYKDSVRNIEATGEFVCNLATRALAEQVNLTSAVFPHGVDEFEAAGLEKADAMVTACPRVAASPAALECRSVEVRQLHDLLGEPVDSWMVIGQVVAVHLDPSCIEDGLFLTERAHPILRAGYAADYWEIGETGKFAMWRPRLDG